VILDVAAALARLLEPTEQVEIVVLDVPPLTWKAGHLYLFPLRDDTVGIESGPTVRQDFDIRVVYIVSNEGEEASKDRSPELAKTLDEKRHAYMETIRTHQSGPLWAYLRAAMDAANRTLQNRGLALRVSGYRIVA
jgi:hypothetical protein